MIWLIGSKGMLGKDVRALLENKKLDFCSSDLDIDITDIAEINKFLNSKKIEWIINCAAYTAVDKAEDESEKAYAINSTGAANLAEAAKSVGAKLIHISTDYVFSGNKAGEYTEEDLPDPIGVYGKSKLEGEQGIQSCLSDYFIIRVAWLYGIHGKNFPYTILRLLNEKNELRIVNDQIGSPTYTCDIASLLLNIIEQDSNKYGIYHFTNEGRISWYDFAVDIAKRVKEKGIIDREIPIIPITTEEFPTKAQRPANSYMSKVKVKSAFGINIRSWQEALEEFLEKVK